MVFAPLYPIHPLHMSGDACSRPNRDLATWQSVFSKYSHLGEVRPPQWLNKIHTVGEAICAASRSTGQEPVFHQCWPSFQLPAFAMLPEGFLNSATCSAIPEVDEDSGNKYPRKSLEGHPLAIPESHSWTHVSRAVISSCF